MDHNPAGTVRHSAWRIVIVAGDIVLTVIGIELMPCALSNPGQVWIVLLAFIAVGGFYVLIDNGLGVLNARLGQGASTSSARAVYFGVAMDLFSDGIMIGAGSSLSLGL